MRMRIDDRIDAIDVLPQTLGAKVWRRVHLQDGLIRPNLDRRPQPLVPGVGRRANPTLTTDDRNPVGSACA